MKKLAIVAVAFLLSSSSLNAQYVIPDTVYRFTITPVVGWSFTGEVTGNVVLAHQGALDNGLFQSTFGSGAFTGLNFDYLFLPRLSGFATALVGSRDPTLIETQINGDLIARVAEGSDFFVGRLGGRFELLESNPDLRIHHPRAYAYGGLSGLVEHEPDDFVTSRNFFHPALFIGFDGEFGTPLRHVSITAGVDDTYVFWGHTALERTFNLQFTNEFGTTTLSSIETSNTNLFMIRAGIAYRF